MKSYELQPTFENILNTFLSDSIDRDADVIRFVTILNSIEDSCSIALDGYWGSGKTFFVNQVKLILDAYNDFISTSVVDEKVKIRKHIVQNFDNKDVGFQPQVSVYYDAWINDNDEDPILSLIYAILQNVNSDYSFKREIDCLKAVSSIVEFFTGKKINALIEALKSENPLSELEDSKDIHCMVEEFLDSLLAEQGDRLVIFIDELDRCKPSYAVHLLERIKHYFSNDRITFVFSVNISELQHTVKQYYGNDFNACKYLDRFFDLRITLPPANMQKFCENISFKNSSHIFEQVMFAVIDIYHFELREIAKFVKLAKIAAYKPTHVNSRHPFPSDETLSFCLCWIAPILIGLKISDITRYSKFISGNDCTPLFEIIDHYEFGEWIYAKLLNDKETYEENEPDKIKVDKKERLKLIYDAIFVNKTERNRHSTTIGKLTFYNNTRLTIERIVSLLSEHADFSI